MPASTRLPDSTRRRRSSDCDAADKIVNDFEWPSGPLEPDREDPLAPARGMLTGLLIGACLWVAILTLTWFAIRAIVS